MAYTAPPPVHLLTLGLGSERLRTQLWPARRRLLRNRARPRWQRVWIHQLSWFIIHVLILTQLRRVRDRRRSEVGCREA